MSGPRTELASAYRSALCAFLDGAGEAALARAYELGRKAMVDGLALLDLVALHHEAMAALDVRDEKLLARAAEFLAETLSPFEMTLRGYRDANARLATLNTSLEERNRELQHARASAEEANRELEAFSYSVAHDLRAPLRSLDGFSQALLEDYDRQLDDEGKKYLRYVRQSARHMGALIDGLLMLSRVSRAKLQAEPVDLSALATESIQRLRHADPDRRIEVEIESGLSAEGDRMLLSIVLDNLLGNAWKFSKRNPEARIELRRDSTTGAFLVRDNGAGFDMRYAEKLFGVFQRLHGITDFEGTGIGLATVQRIVRRHGGRIWAEGAVDRGATFFFTLSGATEDVPCR